MKVSMSDLEMALEFCSSDYMLECAVYVDRSTGEFYYDSEGSEDELPDDLFDSDKYIEIPNKKDLGLGKPLVIQFTTEKLPGELDNVYQIFSRKGAYQRYKALLDGRGKLDDWYQYEKECQQKALLEWCKINNIEVNQ